MVLFNNEYVRNVIRKFRSKRISRNFYENTKIGDANYRSVHTMCNVEKIFCQTLKVGQSHKPLSVGLVLLKIPPKV